jgi:hypothetical protein
MLAHDTSAARRRRMLTDMEETREVREKREKQLDYLSNENAALKEQVDKLEKVVTTLSVHEADDNDDDDDDDGNVDEHADKKRKEKARHGEAEDLLLLLRNESEMSPAIQRMIKLAQGQSLLEGRVRTHTHTHTHSLSLSLSVCPQLTLLLSSTNR